MIFYWATTPDFDLELFSLSELRDDFGLFLLFISFIIGQSVVVSPANVTELAINESIKNKELKDFIPTPLVSKVNSPFYQASWMPD